MCSSAALAMTVKIVVPISGRRLAGEGAGMGGTMTPPVVRVNAGTGLPIAVVESNALEDHRQHFPGIDEISGGVVEQSTLEEPQSEVLLGAARTDDVFALVRVAGRAPLDRFLQRQREENRARRLLFRGLVAFGGNDFASRSLN